MNTSLDTVQNIVVIGLGHVGLPLAVVLAERGHNVFGVEVNSALLQAIYAKKVGIYEPGLDAKLSAVLESGKLQVGERIPPAIHNRSYIVTVGTPIRSDYSCNLDSLRDVIIQIRHIMRDGDMVVLRSTIRPGVARRIALPMLNEAGVEFDFAFCPERIVEGKAFEELVSIPQIVGGITEKSVSRACELFATLGVETVPVNSLESAEIVKLINNMSRDLSFALSNEIATFCDVLGVDATEVMYAATKGYKRTELKSIGLVGGPCLSKDTYLFQSAFERANFEPRLTLTARSINEAMPVRGANNLAQLVRIGRSPSHQFKIGLLGLAFKGRPETRDTRGTMALAFIEALQSQMPGAVFYGFDVMVPAKDMESLGVTPRTSLIDTAIDCDAVVVLNNHPAFDHLPLTEFDSVMKNGGIVYDFWPPIGGRTVGALDNIDYLAYGDGAKLAWLRDAAAQESRHYLGLEQT